MLTCLRPFIALPSMSFYSPHSAEPARAHPGRVDAEEATVHAMPMPIEDVTLRADAVRVPDDVDLTWPSATARALTSPPEPRQTW